MSSTTAGTYPAESVSSCHPPTPPPSPPPHPAPASAAAIHGAQPSRPFDFADASSGGGDPEEEEEDYDPDFIRVVEYIERARPCACWRGRCRVEWDEQRGRWVYVCPAKPKCNYVSVCEEVGLDSGSQPADRSHPSPSNHVAEPRTPINNVSHRGAGATNSNIISPQATIPKTPLNSTFQSAGTSTPLHVSPRGPSATAAATIPKTPLNSTFQSAGTSASLHVSPRCPSATAVVKITPQGAGSNDKPICKCNAGKCIVLRKGGEDYYVCPIPKGSGACSYMAPVVAAVNEPTETETRGDKHLKDNLVEKEDNGNNLDQAQDNNANGSDNPPQPDEKEVNANNLVQAQDNNANGSVPLQPDEKEVRGNNLVQAQGNNANGSVNSQSDDEWPFEVVNDEIVLTAQTSTSAEVRQASPPSMKCETTAMAAEAPAESPVPPYDASSPINPRSENRVSPTGRLLEAFGELMISCCSGQCPS